MCIVNDRVQLDKIRKQGHVLIPGYKAVISRQKGGLIYSSMFAKKPWTKGWNRAVGYTRGQCIDQKPLFCTRPKPHGDHTTGGFYVFMTQSPARTEVNYTFHTDGHLMKVWFYADEVRARICANHPWADIIVVNRVRVTRLPR